MMMKCMLFLLCLFFLYSSSFGQISSPNTLEYAIEQADMARKYYKENKLDSAVMAARNALKYSPENPTKEERKRQTETYIYLSQLYIAKGEHKESLQFLHKAIDIAQKNKDIASVAKCQHIIGNAMFSMGEKESALDECVKAYQTAISINDYDRAASSQLTAATICNALKRYDEAIEHSKLVIEYGVQDDNKSFYIGSGWHLMAGALFEQKKYGETLHTLHKALIFYEKAGQKTLVPVVENAIAYVKTLMGDDKVKDSVMRVALDEVKSKDANKAIVNPLTDSLLEGAKNSYENIKLEKMLADYNALEKTTKFEILQQDYFERQATTLRQRIWFVSGLSLLAIVILALLYGRQRQKAKTESIAHYAKQKENEYLTLQNETELRLACNYIEGLESERARISKELHDGVCNDLLALEIELKNSGVDKTKVKLLENAREGVRNISHELLPPQFQYASIDEMLSDFISHLGYAESTSLEYHADSHYDWNDISKEIAFVIYRIVQESLSNSIKHSGATRIKVSLSEVNGHVCIEIVDNGVGFDKNKRVKGAGLLTVYDRVKGVGGVLDIDTSLQGTAIKASFKI